jgi:RNA polymerase sigma factor (sigma-70 family)
MPPENPEQSQWFAEELQPHEPELRAWLRSRFPPELDFDDIIQDAFVSAWKAQKKGVLKSPKAFLFGVARNLALGSLRSRKVRGYDSMVQIEDCDLLDEKAGVQETVVRNQELQILTLAIQSLPDRCRQIFTLRKVYGMTQREIAKKLDLSPRTVNAQITIGLHKCAMYVKSYCAEGMR